MGLTRKFTSAMTLGAVDFRSDKERTARYTRQTRNAVRQQKKNVAPSAPVSPVPTYAPPGWYYWDGTRWNGPWKSQP